MNASSTDRIEKQIVLKAPPARVWRALSDAEEFGRWFGAALQGQCFVAGQMTKGSCTYPGYGHLAIEFLVVAIEPPRRLSMRWHPCAIDPAVDYSTEEMTLIEFELSEIEGGTLLKVTESGFDQLPASRRAEAFRMNRDGWGEQMCNIERHLDRHVSAY